MKIFGPRPTDPSWEEQNPFRYTYLRRDVLLDESDPSVPARTHQEREERQTPSSREEIGES